MHTSFDLHIDSVVSWFVDPWVQSPYNVIHKFEKTLDKQNEPTMASAMPRNTDILPLTTGCGFFVLRCKQSALLLCWRVFELNRKSYSIGISERNWARTNL